MSNINDAQLLDRAVDLVQQQDDLVQSWTGRYIAVQSGLAVATGVIVGWKGSAPGWTVISIIALLGILAIVFSFLLSAVIKRHLAWQRAYIKNVKEIEGKNPMLFREGMVSGDDGTRVADFFNVVEWVVGVTWLIFLVIIGTVEVCF